MAVYKLIKDQRSNVKILRDNKEIGLYTEVHNLNIPTHGWGAEIGEPGQVAFALAYDVLKNKEQALANYEKISAAISMAAPLELELSTTAIISILSRVQNDS